jgi:hypothetical protein
MQHIDCLQALRQLQVRRQRYLRGSVAAVSCLGLVGLLLTCTPEAEAKAERPFSAEFSLRGSNGYLISVTGSYGGVEIMVESADPRPGSLIETNYSFKGTASNEGIDANLGDFGEISLRFTPSGKNQVKTVRHVGKGCKGPHKVVRRLGTFTGTFRFEGEAGYTSLDVTEADGSIGAPAAFFCSTFSSGSGKNRRRGRPPTYLEAKTPHNKLAFSASLTEHGRRAGFAAISQETLGAASITRWASVEAPPSMLHFARDLSSATVSPPPPFSGTAMFKRRPKRSPPSWSGSLAVLFLGEENTPLTGPRFTSASLVSF